MKTKNAAGTIILAGFNDLYNPDMETGNDEKTSGRILASHGYEDNIQKIKRLLVSAAQDFCGIGYYLKQMQELKQYEKDGFKDIWEMAKEIFGFHKSTTSRHMRMNDLYSEGGNSPFLDAKFKEFSKSQLQEMMTIPDEKWLEVIPEMRVKEIRELKPQKPPKNPNPVPAPAESVLLNEEPAVVDMNATVPDGWHVDDIPESIPEKPVAMPQQDTLPVIIDMDPSWRKKEYNYPDNWPHDEITGLRPEIETHRKFDETPGYNPKHQPELPVLKNMDEREAFINGYAAWPVWCENPLTEETFYRYELPDQSAIVVRQYPHYSYGEESTGWDFYLLKPGYRHFKDGETCMTVLKDHLKEVQKKQT